jgi:hypothetical protein
MNGVNALQPATMLLVNQPYQEVDIISGGGVIDSNPSVHGLFNTIHEGIDPKQLPWRN